MFQVYGGATKGAFATLMSVGAGGAVWPLTAAGAVAGGATYYYCQDD